MKTVKYVCFLVVFALMNTAYAQEELEITAKDSIVQSSWMFGVGFNAVHDSGNMFNGLFNVANEWNIVPYPSRVSIGRYFKSGLGIEAIGTYNQYREGKLIDNQINTENINYFGLDARLTYDLNRIIGETGWFDPYVGIGAGYSEANNLGRGTYNAVVGFRTWFSDRWGLDFNSSGKWAMSQSDGASNHIQHAAGVVYQFGIEKGLSKKGEEKLELLAAIEQEKQRQQDSISEVNRLRDEALLAERLEKEREAAALAAAEKEKLDARNARRTQLENEIDNLGLVYFDLNSSYLNKPYRELLDKLSVILENNPEVTIKVTSHTDSRGAATYNMWLSERRVERTVEYLLNKGIAKDRLDAGAFGETQLLNECDDHTRCGEAKHAVNRRSDFEIIDF